MFQHLCGGGSTATAYAGLFFKAAGIADPDVTATYAWGAASFVGVIFAAFLGRGGWEEAATSCECCRHVSEHWFVRSAFLHH